MYFRVWSELSAELPALQRTQWGLSQPDSAPASQLIALIGAQPQFIVVEESSSSESEDESSDEVPSQPSSQDLFSFFATPPVHGP